MKKARFAALAAALVMALSTVPAFAYSEDALVPQVKAYDRPFADVAGTWCERYVETVYEAGLMEGKSADRFDPNGTLTEAQRLVIGARLHALFHGGTVEQTSPGEAWWLPAARYYLAVDGNTTEDPAAFADTANTPAIRLSFAMQMVWSTPAEHLPAINTVEEIPDFTEAHYTDDTLRQNVLILYRAGVLNGVDRWGKFDPQGTLTRGQAAALLARVINPSLRLRFDQLDLFQDVIGNAPKGIGCTLVQSTEIEGAVALIEMFYEAGGKDFDRILEEIRALPFRSTLTTPSAQDSVAIYNQEALLDACWQMKDHADGHTYSFVISFKDSFLGPWIGHGFLAYINDVWFCTDTERGITCVLDLSEESGHAFTRTLTQIVLS